MHIIHFFHYETPFKSLFVYLKIIGIVPNRFENDLKCFCAFSLFPQLFPGRCQWPCSKCRHLGSLFYMLMPACPHRLAILGAFFWQPVAFFEQSAALCKDLGTYLPAVLTNWRSDRALVHVTHIFVRLGSMIVRGSC